MGAAARVVVGGPPAGAGRGARERGRRSPRERLDRQDRRARRVFDDARARGRLLEPACEHAPGVVGASGCRSSWSSPRSSPGAVYLDQTAPEASGARCATAADRGDPGPDRPAVPTRCRPPGTAPRAPSNGRADGPTRRSIVGNLSIRPIDATVTVMPGGTHEARDASGSSVGALAQARVRVADVLAIDEPGVVVEVFGGPAVVEHELAGQRRRRGRAVRARRRAATGTSPPGRRRRAAEQYLVLFNPYGDDAIVDVTLLTDGGVQAPEAFQGLVVPRRSRVSIAVARPRCAARTTSRSRVHARTGRVVAERTVRSTAPQGRVRHRRLARRDRARAALDRFRSGARRRRATASGRDRELRTAADRGRGRRARSRGAGARRPRRSPVPGAVVVAVDVGSKVASRRQLHRRRARRPAAGPSSSSRFVTQDGVGQPRAGERHRDGRDGARRELGVRARTDRRRRATRRSSRYNPGPKPVTVRAARLHRRRPQQPAQRARDRRCRPGDRGEFDLGAQDIAPGPGVHRRVGRPDRRRARAHRGRACRSRTGIPFASLTEPDLTWRAGSRSAPCSSSSCSSPRALPPASSPRALRHATPYPIPRQLDRRRLRAAGRAVARRVLLVDGVRLVPGPRPEGRDPRVGRGRPRASSTRSHAATCTTATRSARSR